MRAFTLFAVIALAWVSVPALAGDHITEYNRLYNELKNLEGDETKVAAVSGLTIKRDVGTFVLQEGTMYVCTPLLGEARATIFVGRGNFSCTPPTDVERKQLFRYYEKESVETKFKMLFMLFNDTTLQELRSRLTFSDGSVPREVNNLIDYAVNYVTDGGTDAYIMPGIAVSFLEKKRNDLFYAHFSDNKIEPMLFSIDPTEVEEVSFARRNLAWPGYAWEFINHFHTDHEYATGADQEDELKNRFKVLRYAISAGIEHDLDFSASAKLVMQSLKKEQRWVDLNLYPGLDVDSVFWGPGKPAAFVRGKEHYALWVERDSVLKLGQLCSLMVYYRGSKLLSQDENARLYLQSSSTWYPRHNFGFRERASYDLTFRYPSRYTLVSVGKNLSTTPDGEFTISRWNSSAPTKKATFNFGLFKEYPLTDADRTSLVKDGAALPPISVFMSEGQRQTEGYTESATLSAESRDVAVHNVKQDIAASTHIFQLLFGGRPFDHLNVTEIPDQHGEAFPEMINLSWGTFEFTSSTGLEQIFRAHEVAHQWWGISIGFKSYHDQWLSEGFSTYCGIWYMQAALRDNVKFFKELNRWRNEIIEVRDYALGKGREAGPISLGARTASERTSGDYDLIIYRKGAWVLHMLRNMLLDLKTFREDRFNALMAEFYTTYKGHDASTLDFQRITENHFGGDMSWFFKQWVHGTSIPQYEFSHRTVQSSDTTYTVQCRLKQSDVPTDFSMIVPIEVRFADGTSARYRINASETTREFSLPPMRQEPREVEFNYLSSVLCTVETHEWE